MKISLDIDEKLKEIFINIKAPKLDKNVSSIIENLETNKVDKITAYSEARIHLVDINDIYYFYTESRKVFLSTKNNKLWVKHTLSEVENNFTNNDFIRVSKGVIINMNKVSNFDQLFNGNLTVNFINGEQEYVSRRYLKNIKDYLNI